MQCCQGRALTTIYYGYINTLWIYQYIIDIELQNMSPFEAKNVRYIGRMKEAILSTVTLVRHRWINQNTYDTIKYLTIPDSFSLLSICIYKCIYVYLGVINYSTVISMKFSGEQKN